MADADLDAASDAGSDAGSDAASVGSAETVATVDERVLQDGVSQGEPSSSEEDDGAHDGAHGGGGGGGGGGPRFRVREVACGHSILVIVDLSLPPAGRPSGRARLGSFLYLRQCEELLYGATAGSYTGALHMAVKVTLLRELVRATKRPTPRG